MKIDSVKSPLYKSSDYGELFDDSNVWQDRNLGLPKNIVVRSGAIVDSVAFQYQEVRLPHGSVGGADIVVDLQNGEYITKVTGDFKYFRDVKLLNRLTFTSNMGNTYDCNCGGGTDSFSFEPGDGYAIYCLHGKSSTYVGGIGFYAAKIDSLKNKSIPEMPNMTNPFDSISDLLNKK